MLANYTIKNDIPEAEDISVPHSSGSNIDLSIEDLDDFSSSKSIWSVPDFVNLEKSDNLVINNQVFPKFDTLPTSNNLNDDINKNMTKTDVNRKNLELDVITPTKTLTRNPFKAKSPHANNPFKKNKDATNPFVKNTMKVDRTKIEDNKEHNKEDNKEQYITGNKNVQLAYEVMAAEDLIKIYEKEKDIVMPNQNLKDEKSNRIPFGNIPTMEKSSLTVGIDNVCEAKGSLITGSNNKIVNNNKSSYEKCFNITSSVIAGGNNNTIRNSYQCARPTAMIASSDLNVQDCEDCVFLGVRNPGETLKNLKQTTVAHNFHAIGKLKVAPLSNNVVNDTLLDILGSAYFGKDVNIDGNLNSTSSSVNSLVANNATIHNLNVTNISRQAEYVVSMSDNEVTKIIHKGDGISTIYANPIMFPVYIQLGAPEDPTFELNRNIFIKDASLIYGNGSSNNVYISVPIGIRIEIYQGSNIVAVEAGTYVITSSGGAVTLRYMAADPNIPDMIPTWIIESQLIGNPRYYS